MRVCFFAKVSGPDVLSRVEFYKQDIDILRDLGFEVFLATRWKEIRRDVDFYFVWWWQWGFLPLLKGAFRARPCLITGVFDFRWASGKDYFHRPFHERWLMKRTLKGAKANVFISSVEYHDVSRALCVTNPVYIPLGIDTNLYTEGVADREDFALTVAWMNAGNSWRKCVPEVVQAIPLIRKLHPEMRFIIAGEKGTDYAGLASLAKELGVSDYVEFSGVIPREKKIELMQRCKVYVSPSRYEGFGLAILEAMSCGAPVVSSPVGAVPELVGDTGLLVDGTSPEAIAGAVNQYLDDEGLRKTKGRAGRARAQSVFPHERRKRELGHVISEMMKKS